MELKSGGFMNKDEIMYGLHCCFLNEDNVHSVVTINPFFIRIIVMILLNFSFHSCVMSLRILPIINLQRSRQKL